MTQKTVLFIDDGLDNRVLVKAFLERAGYRALLADHGEAGLVVLEAERPDLVLLDYMMPGMDGAEVARRIRQRPEHRDLPIIVLTASAGDEAIEQAFAAGADDYMTKPFDRRIMLARIGSSIRAAEDRAAARLGLAAKTQVDALLSDLAEATRVQQAQFASLPACFPDWCVMGAVVPASHVGGDLLQVYGGEHGSWFAVVLDISGHGTAAALVASSAANELRNQLASRSPTEAMAHLCAHFAQLGAQHYACVAALHVSGDQVTVVNAGLPPVAQLRAGRVIASVAASGIPPGLWPGASYGSTTITMERGDRLVVVSDGLTESMGAADDLAPCLAGLGLHAAPAGLPSHDLQQRIRRLFEGRTQDDDATLLALDYAPAAREDQES